MWNPGEPWRAVMSILFLILLGGSVNGSMREKVLELLADAEIRLQREDAEMALGWVVLSVDDESGCVSVFGDLGWSELDANEFAVRHHSDLNKDCEGVGWSVKVLPILPV